MGRLMDSDQAKVSHQFVSPAAISVEQILVELELALVVALEQAQPALDVRQPTDQGPFGRGQFLLAEVASC